MTLAACSGPQSPDQLLSSVDMPIAAGQVRELTFDAPPDLPIMATVSGQGIDIKVELVAGNLRTGFADAPNRRMGVETMFLPAPHEPTVTLRIASNDHSGASGVARLHAVSLPDTTKGDRLRIEATRLEAEGCLRYPDPESVKASLDAFLAAERLHSRAGAGRQAGLAGLHAAGIQYTRLSAWKQSARLAADAAEALSPVGAREHLAYALRLEGAALDQEANAASGRIDQREVLVRRARERLSESYALFNALGDDYEAGYALNYRGVSFDVAGERDAARADFLLALRHFRDANDRPAQALSLQSLALQSHQDGRLGDAIREFEEAIALIPRDEDPGNYAHTLHNSALPLRTTGRFDEAIRRFHEAGDLLHALRDREGEARALHGLGTTFMHAGEPDRAIEVLQAAIDLRGPAGSRREQAASLMALGESERQLGLSDDAIAHQSAALMLAAAPHELAQAQLFLARAYIADGQPGAARASLEAILELPLPDTHLYRGLALAELGTVDSQLGRMDSSEAYFERAIEVLQAIDSDLELARTLVARATARSRVGNHDAVIADCGAAIDLFEVIGLRALQAESRAAFRASYRLANELEIAALIAKAEAQDSLGIRTTAQQLLQAALAVSDRNRAQLTAGPNAQISPGVAAGMQDSETSTFEMLAGKRALRDRLQAGSAPDLARLAELTRVIARLRSEAMPLMASDKAQAPTDEHGRSLAVFAGQELAVPSGIIVAEFFVGPRRAWVFEARGDRVAVKSLGSSDRLEELARSLHGSWKRRDNGAADRLAESRQLAALLFEGMSPPDVGETLYLVPDGPLHIIPIAVLARQIMPAAPNGAFQTGTSYESVLARHRWVSHRFPRVAAIVADPVYERDDPRIRDSTLRAGAAPAAAFQTRHAERLTSLRRLPSTAVEANAILRLAAPRGPSLKITGPDATWKGLMAAGLDQYRIVHFATHAFSDSQDPALSTLALSRFDRNGAPLNGDLPAFGIASLGLNADLVVLSACDTALGREIVGEAPLGLAQTFLRSGVHSVLATLWQVPDTATARLMEEFYRQVLAENRMPAAALELAQRHVRSHPRWSDPYYWAGFQLVSSSSVSASNNDVD